MTILFAVVAFLAFCSIKRILSHQPTPANPGRDATSFNGWFPFIRLGGERRREVKFLVYGNSHFGPYLSPVIHCLVSTLIVPN